MKKFNYTIRRLREKDTKIGTFRDSIDALITSEEFLDKFRGYIEDIARFKTIDGRKAFRSTEYAAIGIMDANDLIQEANLAFFEAYAKFKDLDDAGKFDYEDEADRGATIWSYLKRSTILNFERQLRNKKDSIRVTERELFQTKSLNTNLLTTLFGQLDKVFFNNQEDVALSKWETDLTGSFLEVHMDEYLDLTFKGNRNLRGIERLVIKEFYGIDGERKTSRELAEAFDISISTIDVLRKRAIDKLKSKRSKEEISNFLREYRITTQSNYEQKG